MQISRQKLYPWLEKIFGKENVGNYASDPIETIVLINSRGLMGVDLRSLRNIGWTLAGVHANDKGVLQVSFREVIEID